MSENELPKVGHYEFLSEPFHCDFTRRLFMGHLGNHLLNAADFHSNSRGFGMNHLNPQHKTWVLSRLAIEMEEMPPMYERFYVDTWVETALRFFTNRNFQIYNSASGKIYGYARSTWAMIDTETRQPVNIFSINDGRIGTYVESEKQNPMPPLSRVKVRADAPLWHTVETTYNDVDINGHINSLKYLEHVLDLWNRDWYEAHFIRRVDIAYVAETHWGDSLLFYVDQTDEETFCVRICKKEHSSADTQKEGMESVEVCRCQVVFSPAHIYK